MDSIKDSDDFEIITNYFTIPNAEIIMSKIIDKWYNDLVDYIVNLNQNVGISVFTFELSVAQENCVHY